MNIRNKLLALFITISIVSVSALGWVAFNLGRDALRQEAFNKLTVVREMKASQIEDYFQIISDQVITFSEDRMIIEAVQDLDAAMQGINDELALSGSEMDEVNLRLEAYYQDEFLQRLNANLIEDASIESFLPAPLEVRLLQDLFLTSNPFDTGLKHFLEDPGDGSTYSELHRTYHPIIRNYLERFGYYDIFLLDVEGEGRIVYSVFKEVDFGTSLLDGPYQDTNFSKAYRAARAAEEPSFVHLEDFEPYPPSYNAPAAFIASPIFDEDTKVGVLIFQLPIDRINDIMTNRQQWTDVGLGSSGETYLVGDDFFLRNQSRFLIEDSKNYFKLIEAIGVPESTISQIRNLNSTIGLQEVNTEGTRAALAGETGTGIFPDYRGVSVLSSYKPLNIAGAPWAIMSEIDEDEAFYFVQELGNRTLLVAVGVFAAATLVSLIFSLTITNPLTKLTDTAEMLSYGSWDTHVEYTDRKDEIGSLARNFVVMRDSLKRMVNNLEEFNRTLEQRVRDRTRELKYSEHQSRSIVDTAGEGIIVLDKNQNVVLWNQSAVKMFGYSQEEMIGQSMNRVLPEELLARHKPALENAIKSSRLKHPGETHEFVGIKKSGERFPLELTLSIWSIDDDLFISGILRDITERKTAEEAVRVSNERVRTIVEIAPDAIITINEEQNITLFNPQASEIFGYTEEEILGQPLTILMPEKSRKVHPSEIDQFSAELDVTRDMDTRRDIFGQRKDGTVFPAEAGISKMVVDGQLNFTTIFRDITARKEAEQLIRDREERLSAISAALPDLAFVVDEDGRYVNILTPLLDMLARPVDELIGHTFHEILKEDVADLHLENIQQAITTGEIQQFEYRLVVPSGDRWFDGRCAPISDSIGEKRLAILLARDITDRRTMENQLAHANERMSEELNFAREIQMSLLPLIFPAFPNRNEFSIFAQLIPAREVGGDFYDFYFIDEYRLCFVIGDVSGKGAPGALLMAVSKTLIKSRAMDDFQPASILTHVNNELSQNNDSAMFVTVFLGILDIRTGKIEYTNAGHNPPYIKRANGLVETLDAFHGPVIGALPNLHYKEDSTSLHQDDMIFIYTDGVTEAMDEHDILFSEKRLEAFLATDVISTPQKLTDQIIRAVKEHEGEAEQADDITVLGLKFTGDTDLTETGRLDVTIKNQISDMEIVESEFEAFSKKHGVGDTARQQVSMVLDELLNNIINYAYRDDDEHAIEVEFVIKGPRLGVTVRDDGVPFNPFAIDPPNIAHSLDDREVGGLGIFLVRSVMDEYMYNRHIGKNVVNLVKLIEKP